MDRLLKIMREIDDTVDFEHEQHLIDDHLLDSFGVITLIAEIEDEFGVSIDAVEIVPENFNSAESLWKLISGKLQEL